MDAGDAIWNRALGESSAKWESGDRALAAALRFHNAAMGGGVLDAVESLEPAELDAAAAAYEWLGLRDVVALISEVRSQIADGALEDDDRADELEASSDDRYDASLPTDADLEAAFRNRLVSDPGAFAKV